jgi:hypothetical protein
VESKIVTTSEVYSIYSKNKLPVDTSYIHNDRWQITKCPGGPVVGPVENFIQATNS